MIGCWMLAGLTGCLLLQRDSGLLTRLQASWAAVHRRRPPSVWLCWVRSKTQTTCCLATLQASCRWASAGLPACKAVWGVLVVWLLAAVAEPLNGGHAAGRLWHG